MQAMNLVGREAMIEGYRTGHGAILKALSGVDAARLDQRSGEEWSAREIVHHLTDTELFRSVRLRQLLSQDEPVIQAFDELKLVERAYYTRPAEVSLAVFDAAVRSNLELLALMSAADWARMGTHTEVGPFTMDMWLQRAADHLNEHARQLAKTLAQGQPAVDR
jgi:hypothetical protein